MSFRLHSSARAFTLLECLVYIGILAIVAEGILISFFLFSRTIERSEAEAHLTNEGQFILSRLTYEHRTNVSLDTLQDLIDPRDTIATSSVSFTSSAMTSVATLHFILSTHDGTGSVISLPFAGTWNISLPL